MKETRSITQQIEDEFGLVEVYKLLENEVVLGTIDEIPMAQSRNSTDFGMGKATITDKRLIIDSQAIEPKNIGRYTFYYETWLNKIEDIKVVSYDTNKHRMFIPGIVSTAILALFCVIMGICLGSFFVYVGCAAAVVSLALMIPFLPHKFRYRSFALVINTSGGKLEIGNTKDADLFVAVSIDSVDKLTLLARGIRRAQHIE